MSLTRYILLILLGHNSNSAPQISSREAWSLSLSLSFTLFHIPPYLHPLSLPPFLFSLPPCLLSLLLRCGQRTGEEAGVCGRLHQSERSPCLCLVLWQDRLQRWEHECECVWGGGVFRCHVSVSRYQPVGAEWGWMGRQRGCEWLMIVGKCACVWLCVIVL